jgi:hypothetical protein
VDEEEKARVHLLIKTLLERLAKLDVSTQLFYDTIFEQESDWAFVIRLHTVIEASLNDRIITALGDQRLFPIISRLDIGDQTRGKLAFAKALNLLPDEYRSFVKWFGELRNSLVHNAKNLDFSIQGYLTAEQTLYANITKSLQKIFPAGEMGRTMEIDPRTGIFLGGMAVIVYETMPSEGTPLSESNPKES